MKNLIFFSLILFLISGCSLNLSKSPESLPKAIDNQAGLDQSELTKEEKGTENKKVESAKELETEPTVEKTGSEIDPYQFSFLVSQYSQAKLKTNFGDITLKFYNQEADFTVNNFLNLAKLGFYNGTKFHRVMKGFMIQGGDPNSKDDNWGDDGMGGPGYVFKDEFNQHLLVRGSLAMANSGPNTNGSQFFIVTAEATPWLDGKHTNFGYVVEGLEVIDTIENIKTNEQAHPLEDVIIESISLIE
ncbi:peptidylprolyl isomerase [Patescibacteria group bacterium]|nr:peptidylprolyl isomerase [Patescibacteria group bacterium]